jgi:hypothetical protein
LNQDGTGKLKLVDEEQSYMQLMGEEYSKEEILRIPPTFSGFDSKAFETFFQTIAFEKPFSKIQQGKST